MLPNLRETFLKSSTAANESIPIVMLCYFSNGIVFFVMCIPIDANDDEDESLTPLILSIICRTIEETVVIPLLSPPL